MNAEEFDNYELDKDVGAVVLGLDTNFTMNKLFPFDDVSSQRC